jgi:pimeloyl-ACP methyl ester carboxylesterase
MSTRSDISYADADGVRLATASAGTGTPVVFIHELAGDLRNWEPQVQAFSRRYRCLTYNARGYPPSDVPSDPVQYSQALAVGDLVAVLRHHGVERAHAVGLSMGGYAALNFALAHPDKTLSVVAAGTGHGSDLDTRDQFLAGTAALADRIESVGLEVGGHDYLHGPTRRRFREKHPDGFATFNRQFAEHSALGTALTIRGCQLQRPTLQELEPELAQLSVLPRTTHTVNLEEPDAFDRVVLDFLADVDGSRRS